MTATTRAHRSTGSSGVDVMTKAPKRRPPLSTASSTSGPGRPFWVRSTRSAPTWISPTRSITGRGSPSPAPPAPSTKRTLGDFSNARELAGAHVDHRVRRRAGGHLIDELIDDAEVLLAAHDHRPSTPGGPRDEPDHDHDDQDEERGQRFGGLGDRDRVIGMDEEEVVGDRRRHRRNDARSQVVAGHRNGHRPDEHDEREVGTGHLLPNRDQHHGDGDGDRHGDHDPHDGATHTHCLPQPGGAR